MGRAVLGQERRAGAPSQCQCLRRWPFGGAWRGGSASLCVGCQCSRDLGSGSQGRRDADACGGSLHDDCRWGRSMCGARSPSSRGGSPAEIVGEVGPGSAQCSVCGGGDELVELESVSASAGAGRPLALVGFSGCALGASPAGVPPGPLLLREAGEDEARGRSVTGVSGEWLALWSARSVAQLPYMDRRATTAPSASAGLG